jgi:hypothetical protein
MLIIGVVFGFAQPLQVQGTHSQHLGRDASTTFSDTVLSTRSRPAATLHQSGREEA